MLDYGKRFLIVLLVGICISLLFIGGRLSAANGIFERPGLIWAGNPGLSAFPFGENQK
ncbi:hypothetical protein [Peribacillus kribbensis]|uniref:hypothetical protein n=1 Tax=Peribacillus kribbensis TaxID=356658 RepID=UPI0004040D20|nr:hypothetical protein [Peribacillus kribbensis]